MYDTASVRHFGASDRRTPPNGQQAFFDQVRSTPVRCERALCPDGAIEAVAGLAPTGVSGLSSKARRGRGHASRSHLINPSNVQTRPEASMDSITTSKTTALIIMSPGAT